MPKLPFTYFFDFEHFNDVSRRWVMYELARQGARHLVLTDVLIGMVMRQPRLRCMQSEVIAAGRPEVICDLVPAFAQRFAAAGLETG